MSIQDFFKNRYKILRESEALGISLLVHAILIVLMGFVVISTSDTVRDALRAITHRQEIRQAEPPRPIVQPKDIPVDIPPPPPRMQQMPQLEQRMVVRRDVPTQIRPTEITRRQATQVSFAGAKTAGSAVRTRMHRDYATRHGVEGAGRTIRAIIEQFVVVEYEGGDWDCEFHRERGELVPQLGSVANLIREIMRRTDIDVRNTTPVVVRADSPEIHKSPFVYFTGHRDFTLTPAEVENLRTYLIQGGCIVANNSLPGRRSRFDVAFRREMRRVIPDHDLEPLPNNYPLFRSFVQFERPPEGMNYWREPIEVIRIDNRVVLIYNLNNYGGLMLAALDDAGNAIKTGLHAEYEWRWEGPRNWMNTRRIYANADDFRTVLDAYMFNVNTLVYILTR